MSSSDSESEDEDATLFVSADLVSAVEDVVTSLSNLKVEGNCGSKAEIETGHDNVSLLYFIGCFSLV